MKLIEMKENERCRVTQISTNQNDVIRLYKLGIVVGVEITLLLKLAGGGVVIDVLGSEIAIGRQVANKIGVEK